SSTLGVEVLSRVSLHEDDHPRECRGRAPLTRDLGHGAGDRRSHPGKHPGGGWGRGGVVGPGGGWGRGGVVGPGGGGGRGGVVGGGGGGGQAGVVVGGARGSGL